MTHTLTAIKWCEHIFLCLPYYTFIEKIEKMSFTLSFISFTHFINDISQKKHDLKQVLFNAFYYFGTALTMSSKTSRIFLFRSNLFNMKICSTIIFLYTNFWSWTKFSIYLKIERFILKLIKLNNWSINVFIFLIFSICHYSGFLLLQFFLK